MLNTLQLQMEACPKPQMLRHLIVHSSIRCGPSRNICLEDSDGYSEVQEVEIAFSCIKALFL
jgi:hypothetical protein